MKNIVFVLAATMLLFVRVAEAQRFPERWVYFSWGLRTDASAEKAIQLLRDAKASGCTHALFTHTRGHRTPNEPPAYFDRVKRFQAEARKLNIKIIPSVFSTGYSGRYLNVDSNLVRRYAPAAKLYTWSDMFTPHHNARPFKVGKKVNGYYYLVNGNWDGSWEGLPKDVIILNWYSPTRENIRFFADRGHPQVLCGFYDQRTTDKMKQNIHKWMTVSKGAPGIRGFMFTTWGRRYQYMKEYFRLLDTYDTWKKDMPAGK